MDKYIAQHVSPEARKSYIEGIADGVETIGYNKPLTSAEVEEIKEQLTKMTIRLYDAKESKREYLKEANAQIKDLEESHGELTRRMKSRHEYVDEVCYRFVDEETRQTGYYNADGLLVYERPARPDELQSTIFKSLRCPTGTDD